MHSNWRDCDAWRHENLPMNTTSNEACKLYDISLSQIVGWKENAQHGGLVHSLNSMCEADPDFIIGHCLKTGMELLGSNINLNSTLSYNHVQSLVHKANLLGDSLTKREKMHVKGVELLQNGNLPKASEYWEQILLEHPNDILAIKFLHSAYFYLGDGKRIHESIARVLPLWNQSTPYYNYLYGMYAFGLSQDNYFDRAEKSAMKGLELNRFDAWSTHAICHVNEYRSTFDKGIKFLLDTESDWKQCELIAGHNYWHMALYYIEKNEIEPVLDILDTKLLVNLNSLLELINSSSILLRLKLNNYSGGTDSFAERWKMIKEKSLDRIEKHGYMYSDSHIAMTLASCGTEAEKSLFLSSVNQFVNSDSLNGAEHESIGIDGLLSELSVKSGENENYLKRVNAELKGIFEALFFYEQKEFEKTVELLYPIRYEVRKIGGSNAQRDIFNLLLIDSAFKSGNKLHNKLGLALLNERLLNKPDSELTRRLAARFFVNE